MASLPLKNSCNNRCPNVGEKDRDAPTHGCGHHSLAGVGVMEQDISHQRHQRVQHRDDAHGHEELGLRGDVDGEVEPADDQRRSAEVLLYQR